MCGWLLDLGIGRYCAVGAYSPLPDSSKASKLAQCLAPGAELFVCTYGIEPFSLGRRGGGAGFGLERIFPVWTTLPSLRDNKQDGDFHTTRERRGGGRYSRSTYTQLWYLSNARGRRTRISPMIDRHPRNVRGGGAYSRPARSSKCVVRQSLLVTQNGAPALAPWLGL